MAGGFIPPHGGYKRLLSYRKAQIIYDATYHFCRRFIDPRSRTVDQMVQAARSGKQNIIEGSVASGTSKETEIKLTNVARASLEELRADYEDYLRVNKLPLWAKDAPGALEARHIGMQDDCSYAMFEKLIEQSDAETAANTIICLIHQATYLLDRQKQRLEADFAMDGGIRERMARARYSRRTRREEG